VQGLGDRPNAYIYFITQAAVWPAVCKVIGEESWIDDEAYATPAARPLAPEADLRAHRKVDDDQGQVRGDGDPEPVRHPVRPILSMKEIAEDEGLRASGTIVEVDHPTRASTCQSATPIKMSDSATDVTRSPAAGEHTEEVLAQLGYSQVDIAMLARREGHLNGANMSKDKAKVRQLLDAVKGRRGALAHSPEGKLVCDAYGIAVPQEALAASAAEAGQLAAGMGFPVVMKIVSPTSCTRPKRAVSSSA